MVNRLIVIILSKFFSVMKCFSCKMISTFLLVLHLLSLISSDKNYFRIPVIYFTVLSKVFFAKRFFCVVRMEVINLCKQECNVNLEE